MSNYLNKFNNYIDNDVILSIKKYAIENDVPIITDDGLSFLLLLIDLVKPKKVLEIGTAIGYSAINMACKLPNLRIDTIERSDSMYELAKGNIKNANLNDRINLFKADALEIDLNLLDSNYDLIFIDAAKAQYIKFFEKFEKLLSDDGVILSDNLSFHGLVEDDTNINSRNLKALVNKIKRYNIWLSENDKYKTTFLNIGDGMSISKKV